MDAPLSVYTIENQRVKPAEIHRRMLTQYGTRTMNQWKVYEWVERFKEERTSVTSKKADLVIISISITEEHIHRTDALIGDDRRIMLACGQAIVHDDLGYRKGYARWVPKQTNGADVSSRATTKLLTMQVHCCAEGLYRKATYAFVLHLWK